MTTATTGISFHIGADQRAKLHAILTAAVARKVIKPRERMSIEMSVSACIAQGQPLDLDKLAAFDDFNLAHDLFGIHRHIDKDDDSPTAGKLLNQFLPRCAR